MSRRRLLRTGSALAAAAVATGIVGSTGTARAAAPGPTPQALSDIQAAEAALAAVESANPLHVLGKTTLREPGSLPSPGLPVGTNTLPGIENIVVLIMENHSFDSLFGMLGRGDGFTLDAHGRPTASSPYPGGGVVQNAFPMPTTCQLLAQPSQEWTQAHACFNNGFMDGFVSAPFTYITAPLSDANCDINGPVAMGYFTAEQMPFTYSLASQFPIGDRWFSSVMGQTSPNRRYVIAATSAGMCNDPGTLSSLQSPGDWNTLWADFGLAVPNITGTIFNMLDAHGISWANYAEGSFPTGTTPEEYPVNDTITEGIHLKPWSQFFTDAANGTLPQFSFLDEGMDSDSEENPENVARGDALLSQVVRALGNSPQWAKTMLIITYDEHGGYYDHVAPPAALAPDPWGPQPNVPAFDGFNRYGFRVPAVVVSPYAKKNHVSSLVHDHSSIAAFLERKWNLPALTYRDANANDLTDFLDLTALAAGTPTFPGLPQLADPGTTPAALACDSTGHGTIPPPGSYTMVLAGPAQKGSRQSDGSWPLPVVSPPAGFSSAHPNSPTVVNPDFVANYRMMRVSQQTTGSGSSFWVVTGADNNAYLQVERVSTGSRLLGFQHLPGNSGAPYFSAKRLAIAATPDGNAQIVAIGLDGIIYHTVYYAASDTFQSSWGQVQTGFQGSDVGIAAMPTGDTQVVTIGTDGQIWHDIRFVNGSWQGFRCPPQPAGTPIRRVSLTIDPTTGNARVIAVNNNGAAYEITRLATDGSWSSPAGPTTWSPVAQTESGPLQVAEAAIAATSGGGTQLALLDTKGELWHQSLSPNTTVWTPAIQPVGFKPAQDVAICASYDSTTATYAATTIYTVQNGPGAK